MKQIHPIAYKFMIGVMALATIYALLLMRGHDHHTHEVDGILITGHDDHMHVTYQPILDIESTSIQRITAYFMADQTVLSIYDGALSVGSLASDCTEMKEWATYSFEPLFEEELSEREYRELRNLYSRITPDFRIDTLPQGEDYGLAEPHGCIAIQTEGEQIFLQFGRQSAQGFSRYLQINRQEPVYVVSRYFYTELENLVNRN